MGVTARFLSVPEQFAFRTVQREQDAGRSWIGGLPRLVGSVVREWDLTLVGPPRTGTVGLVWEVCRRDGTPGMLKVSWQDAETRHEAAALRRWDGNGSVRLVQSCDDAGALLLERLEAPTSLLSLEMDQAVAVAARLMSLLHVPRWSGFDDALARESRTASPSAAYRDHIDELRPHVERAFRSAPHVLLHGDLHYENVLWSGSDWRAIDPKPAHGPREWDLVPLLRNRFGEFPQGPRRGAGIRSRLDALIAATGVEPQRAYLFARYRALRDADYAHRVDDGGFEEVAGAIAEATSRR